MERKQIFSIKKLTVGATSVLIGTGIAFATTQAQAYAADVEKNAETSNNIEETSQQNEFDNKTLPKEETRLQKNNNEGNSSLAQKVEETPTLAQKAAEAINAKLTKDEEKTSLESTTNNKKIDETSSNLTNEKEGTAALRSAAPAISGENEVTDAASDNKEVADDNIVWTKRNGNANLILDKDGLLTIEPVANTDGKLNIMGKTGSTYNTILEDKKSDINKIKKVVFKPGTTASYNMRGAFSGFSNLVEIDLSNLNTTGVGRMPDLFSYGENIEKITLGDNFDTSSVTLMGGMFEGTKKLKSLNLGNKFNTSSVTMFSKMFSGSGLENLDLGDNFYINNAKSIAGMFSNMANLKTLTLGKNFSIEPKTTVVFPGREDSIRTPFQNTNIKTINLPARTSSSEKNIFDLIKLAHPNLKWLKDGEPIDDEKLYGENTLYSAGTYETYAIKYVADPTRDYGSENIVGKIKDGIQEIKVATRQTKDVTRTINFIDNVTGEKIKESVVQTVTLKNSATVDEKTGEKIDHWSTEYFPEVKAPTIDNYINPSSEIVEQKIANPEFSDEKVDIKYQQTRKVSVTVKYLDADNNNARIKDDVEIEEQAIKTKDTSGNIKWTIPVIKIDNPFPREIDNKYELSKILDKDGVEVPKKNLWQYYTWNPIEVKGDFDYNSNLKFGSTIIYTHKKQDVTKSVTRTIRLLDAKDGKQLRVQRPNYDIVEDAIVKQEVILKNTKDLVTNEFTGEWAGPSSFEKVFLDQSHLGYFYNETEYYPLTPEIGGSEKTAKIETKYTYPDDLPEEKITADTKDSIVDIYVTREDMHSEGKKVNTIYKEDATKDYGYRNTKEGDLGLYYIYSTYSRTSDQSEPTVVSREKTIAEKEDTIITVGTKAKVEKTISPIEVKYVADNTKDVSYRNEKLGSATVTTKTTNYTLNEQTGEVTPHEEKTVEEGNPTIITLGTKSEKVIKRTIAYVDITTGKEIQKPTIQEVTLVKIDEIDEKTGNLKEGNWSTGKFSEVEVPQKIGGYERAINGISPNFGEVEVDRDSENIDIIINYNQGEESVPETKTVTRTIKYIDAVTGTEISNEVQTATLSRINIRNKVTGAITEGEWTTAEWEEVTSPKFENYNAPTAEKVASEKVTSDTNDIEEKVYYGKTTSTKEVIPYTTIYKEDKTQEVGYRKVEMLGENGEKVVTITYTPNAEGVVSETKTESQIPAVAEVVVVGTKEKVETKEYNFTTKYLADENLEAGVTKVEAEGEKGVETTTTTYTLDTATGKVTANEPTTQTTAAKDRVVKVGTKATTIVTNQNFKTRYVADESLEKGQRVIREQGQLGSTSVTTTYTVNEKTGIVTKHEGEALVVVPKEEVIEVGTKSTVEKEVLPFAKEVRNNRNLPLNELRVVQVGKDGEVVTTTTYTVDEKTGELTENSSTITTEAIPEITEVGTKVEEQTEDELPILHTTRHLITGTTTEIFPVEEGTKEHKTGVVQYEDKNYQFDTTVKDEQNGIATHYYKLVEEKVPEDAPKEDELPVLLTTRHVDKNGVDLFTPELGFTEAKEGVFKVGEKEYTLDSKSETKEVRTYVYKEVFHDMKGDGATQGELPILYTTRHLITGTTIEILPVEEGTKEHKTGVVQYKDKNYQFDATVIDEKNGITTHYYKLVEEKVPEDAPKEDELPILQITRYLIKGTNTQIADVDLEYKAPKEIITFQGNEYKYDSTEEKDNVRTHYYILVEKEQPTNKPTEKSADKSTQQPVKSLVQEKYVEQSVEKTNDLQTQTSKMQEVKQKQLPKTSASSTMSSLSYAAIGLLVFAARRRNKKH